VTASSGYAGSEEGVWKRLGSSRSFVYISEFTTQERIRRPNAMDESFGKSFAKAQQLSGISLNSFIASVSVSAVIFSLEVLVFLIVRKRFPDL
jgi:hypothetical protein